MNVSSFRSFLLPLLSVAGMCFFSSCTVDEEAALFSGGAATGEKKKEKTTKVKTDSAESWSEKMKEAREEREKERAEAQKEKERELAEKRKKEEAEKKALAEKEAREKAEEKALAEKVAREKEARKKAEAERIAAEKKKREEEREARFAARKKAAEERARREDRGQEVAAVAERRTGGGFFSSLAVSTPSKYKSKGHHVHINNRLLNDLNPSNAKIEISLGEQRARIYKTSGGHKHLVIETQISSGKSGHSTPTGSFRIKEKLEHKRSTLYGRWVNSSGQTIRSDGDSRNRPSGASQFIGAEMPYWMRINGGIGMHIGYVPNGPASHGCIRVPSAVQPLIFSKVGVGTPVTITY